MKKPNSAHLNVFENFKNKINYQWNLDTTTGQRIGEICSL